MTATDPVSATFTRRQVGPVAYTKTADRYRTTRWLGLHLGLVSLGVSVSLHT